MLVRTRPGTGVPVVLLHGLLDSSRGWSGICDALGGPTLAVDLAGFGGSSAATPRVSSPTPDVVQALDEIGPERFVLVGHSLGGAVATAVAERLGDQVAALVLLAPAGFGRISMAEAVSLPGVRTVVDRLLPLALGRPGLVSAAYRVGVTGGPPPEAALVATLADDAVRLSRSARQAVAAVVAAGLAPDGFHRRAVAYEGPVHAVWGGCDRVVPLAHLDAVECAFPRTIVHVWEGMSHHPQREHPERLVALVRRARAEAALPSLAAARRARRKRTRARPAAA